MVFHRSLRRQVRLLSHNGQPSLWGLEIKEFSVFSLWPLPLQPISIIKDLINHLQAVTRHTRYTVFDSGTMNDTIQHYCTGIFIGMWCAFFVAPGSANDEEINWIYCTWILAGIGYAFAKTMFLRDILPPSVVTCCLAADIWARLIYPEILRDACVTRGECDRMKLMSVLLPVLASFLEEGILAFIANLALGDFLGRLERFIFQVPPEQ